jgi:hypothetical protein
MRIEGESLFSTWPHGEKKKGAERLMGDGRLDKGLCEKSPGSLRCFHPVAMLVFCRSCLSMRGREAEIGSRYFHEPKTAIL